MSRDIISRSAINATEALTDALYVSLTCSPDTWDLQGISELVEIINKSSISIKNMCKTIKWEREEKSEKLIKYMHDKKNIK